MARNPSAKPNPAKTAEEQALCFELKRKGLSVRAIASQLRMAPSTVQARLQAAYDDLVLPVAAEVRKIELERLDSWQHRLEERMDEGEDPVRVVPVAVRVAERRSRLLGLDMPVQVEATVHEVSQADLALQEMLREARAAVAADEAELGGAA